MTSSNKTVRPRGHGTTSEQSSCLNVQYRTATSIFSPYLVTTDNMVADIMTKAVDRGTCFKMRAQMMNVHANLRKSLEEHVCSMADDAARIARNLFGPV